MENFIKILQTIGEQSANYASASHNELKKDFKEENVFHSTNDSFDSFTKSNDDKKEI